MKTSISYIYGLYDPRDQRLKYIGKSEIPHIRYRDHIHKDESTAKTAWIKSLRELGLFPSMRMLEITTLDDWQNAERFWISMSRLAGFDLVNGTDGGDGGTERTAEVRRIVGERLRGIKRSEETKMKLSLLRKGKPLPPKNLATVMAYANKIRGTPEARERARKANEIRLANPNERQRLADQARRVHTGRTRPKETGERITSALLGKKASEEAKRRMSIAQRLRFSKPEERLKISQGLKVYFQNK